jgi:hypothetical protein
MAMLIRIWFGFCVDKCESAIWRTTVNARHTWDTLNGIINPKQRDGGFERRLETASLAHGRFQNTGSYVIPYLTIQQVEPIAEVSLFRVPGVRFLSRVVTRTEFRDKLGRVFGCVYSERFWNDQKCAGKLCNRELLS